LVGVASLYGAAGDGGPATAASLALPRGVALDGLGNLYVADTGNHKIRRVDGATGIITTVAGDGVAGGSGDGGPATAARLDAPAAVLVDGLGAVLVADTGNHRIRRIDGTTGIITTVAGDGVAGSSGDGGVATSARLRAPTGLARAPAGDVYIADTGNHRVRRVDAFSGTITNVAGTGAAGGSGDGGPALAATLADPSGLAFEPDGGAGRLHIADAANHRIRVVDLAGGDIVTEAGSGMVDFTGDGGGPLAASFRYPVGVAVAAGGDLCVVDTFNQRIRCVRDGVISTAGGNGRERATGDGGAALSASLQEPRFIAEGPDGALYIAEHGGHQVRRVDPTMRAISVVAGTGSPGDGGDGGPATAARLSSPRGLVIDGDGALLIADVGNHRVRRVDPVTGTISTYAGTGEFGFTGDGVDAASTRLAAPGGLARAPDGDLLIADSLNYRVRRVDAVTHLITTVAGDGTPGAGGDGGPATSAQLSFFHDVAMNPAGELFIADTSNHRVRRVVLDGTISTVAGTGAPGAGGDGGAGVAAQLSSPHGLAVDVDGALLIADTFNQRIRRLVVGGAITTYAGSTYGFGGDGEAPALATFRNPFGVRVMTDGRVLIADTDGPLIREIDAARSRVVTVAGPVDPPGPGPIEAATFVDPHAVVVTTGAVFVAGGDSERVQRLRDDTQLVEAVAGGYPAYPPHPTLARFQFGLGHVGGLAYDATAGVLYVAATDQHTIRAFTVVDPDDVTTWTSAVIAGASFSPGFADGAAASARLRSPTGLYLDEAAGALLIADTGNHVIRSLDLAAGTVATIAGTPSTLGFFGDGGAATDALLYGPRAVTRCPGSGDLYVADTDNHRLRRVQAGSGVITTVLGDGVAASSGQGAPAADFPIDAPMGVACDAAGNVLATSRTAVRLLPAAIALGQAAGEVDGNGPVQTIYGAAPRQGFPERITSCLTGVALAGDATSAGHALVADRCVGYLVELRLDAAS
jgi:sugar lactone lactonase YvrE